MKPAVPLEARESRLQATEQVMQALRAEHTDPAVAQLLETKHREAEQTRAALRAVRPIRTQLKAAIKSRDKLMKKHTAVAEGVQSLAAQLQAKQTELEELAKALRDKAQVVAQLEKTVRAEELAEVPSIPTGNAPGGMSAAQWAVGYSAWQVLRQRYSETGWLDVKSQQRDPQSKRSLEDQDSWRRMNQAPTVCGHVSDCGAWGRRRARRARRAKMAKTGSRRRVTVH